MIKQQIYEVILARQSGMNYNTGIQFQISIINREEAKEITMSNQLGKLIDKKSGADVISKDFPI